MAASRPGSCAVVAALLVAACARQEPGAAPGSGSVEATAQRGPIRLTVRAEPATITAGDRVSLEVTVEAPRSVQLEVPSLQGALGSFTVHDAHAPPPDVEQGVQRLHHRYELDTFAAGQQEIPAVTVRYEGPEMEGELSTAPLGLTVESALGGDEGLRDIRGAVGLPFGMARWLWWSIGGLVAVAGLVLVLWLARRGRGRGAAAEVPVAADVWALAELRRLEGQDLVGRGLVGEFYFALSGIVRAYVERRFGLRAPERTTEEFLAEARSSPVLSRPHQGLLAGFLRSSDLVKFARHRPGAEECLAALDAARGFVEQTRPLPQPEAEPAGAVAGASPEAAA